jgi:hypothetical protein
MTTAALILFECFIVLVIAFGIYAGLHRDNDKQSHKQKHI